DARNGVDFADEVVGCVGDKEIAGEIDGYSKWIIQVCRSGRDAVSGAAKDGVSRHGTDDSRCLRDHANDIVAGVGDVEVSSAIDRYTRRRSQGGIDGLTAIAAEAFLGSTRDGGNEV